MARILIAAITTLDFKEEFNRGCYLRKKYVLFSRNLGNVLMENFFVDKTRGPVGIVIPIIIADRG